ncbi:hypothetical protein Glove_15g35 [Diversispora epigaea]|uniref:Protein kinase domain-containing protein n=1 Tax=Diversispora epigaea TaxID=1348612 RepID=A0A397JM11_9GLOM|nr:hypothetical protein Glove_15g35 [Diversispora epigaea]
MANNLNEVVNEINEISISNKSDTEESKEDYGICEERGNENTDEFWCLQYIKFIDKEGFGKIYSAIWKEGDIFMWNIQQKQWERSGEIQVALKSLNNTIHKIGYIHDENLIHRDFHIGNILSLEIEECLITDLGLSKPADETGISKDSKQKVFRVIPYMAPEVLSDDDNYSKTSDFAMIMFEILTGIFPFYDIPHDKDHALKIFNGYRPEIPSNIFIPQLLIDIKKRYEESEIYKQTEECNKLNLTNPVDNYNTNSSTSYETHPSAI